MVLALIFCSFVAVLPDAAFAGFLGNHNHDVSAAGLNNGTLGADILQELEQVVGRDQRLATETRVSRLENTLRPMFASMPKDDNGRLDGTGVRYLLHRLFSQRHAWFVDGLSNDGRAWNSSSPTDVFKKHAGEHHTLFESHLNDQGFSLHQVAVFGAALEVSVHNENIKRLQVAYDAIGLSQSEALPSEQAIDAIMAYMVIFAEGVQNYSTVTPQWLDRMSRTMVHRWPLWPSTVQFVHEVRNAVLEDIPVDEHATWATTVRIVEEIGERYGRFQIKDCHMLKHELMKVESPGTGRVPLGDFYQPSDNFLFDETIPYLRVLGALDESDPENLGVIIPNYVNSLANCLFTVKYYSVCCLSECESLLGTLESSLAAPDATPARIIELVSKLPSDTVTAPRILPATLVGRLDEIASFHGGRVPLHGRLFTQWLHHAYPRECPYPHMSGTTVALVDDAAEQVGIKTALTKKEIQKFNIEAERKKLHRPSFLDEDSFLPWHHEEELFVPRFEATSGRSMNYFLHTILFVAVLLALSSVLVRTFPAIGGKPVRNLEHKYCV